jgi:hypothetical protein
MHGPNSDAAERQQACAMMPRRPAKNAVLRFRFSSQVLSIFCENALQRAVKVYSEVEKIKVNTDDCAANRPAALPSVSFLVKRVISVRCGNRSIAKRAKRERNLQSEAKINNDKRN